MPHHIAIGSPARVDTDASAQIKTPNAQFFGSMPRSDEDAPQSVIHAPAGFGEFIGVC